MDSSSIVVSDEFELYEDVWNQFDSELDAKDVALRLEIRINPSISTFARKPITIVQGISKIGGILGFLKVLQIIMQLVHEHFFIKNLQKELD